jgi:hypothetical protein
MRLIPITSVLCLFAASHLPAAGETPGFSEQVRPILSRYCFKCHGPDDKARKSDLRLDLREDALRPAESGSAAIVPHKADASELVARIFSTDADDVMPPPSTKFELTAEQKDILKRWIESGAEYQQHWAFVKPVQVTPPTIDVNGKRAEHPIDAFVATKLKEKGLALSPPADAVTLVRRLYLDLIGLPPTPREVDAFVRSHAHNPTASIERLVSELLASPQYGERWARRWLDLARYADTNGYEKDRARSIWPWRDWVIQALNADMPFDRFTIEQLAGDMLPQATAEQLIATGFHRNTMLNEEGGIDPLEFRFHAMTDRVATTGTTWLGLTTGCAQCHTHKFDPITHREYFQMMAFLNNADEPDFELPDDTLDAQDKANLNRAAKLLAELPSKWPADKGGAAGVEKAFTSWLAERRANAVEWQTLRPTEMKTNLPLLTLREDGSILGSGDITKSDTYELTFRSDFKNITAVRLEALPDESLPARGPGLCYYEGPKGDFFMGEFQVTADGAPVKVTRASEDYASNNFGGKRSDAVSAMAATDGDPQTGWSCAGRFGERHEAVFVFDKPLATVADLRVKMLFGRHYACPLGCFRISVTTDPRGGEAHALEDKVAALLHKPDAALTEQDRGVLREAFLLSAPELEKEAQGIRNLRKRAAASVTTLVMRERPAGNPRPTYIHNRGEFTQPTEKVEPGVLAVLPPLQKGASRDRLAFARWLVSPDHPLTARVTVNRAWETFFGRGLVKTSQDFGYQGDVPSHPELLDWLAIEFVKQGWSMKKLHKLIVTSASYQQSSTVTPGLLAQDSENKWLARAPRPRLEAEIVRDSVLKAAGLLSPKMGGPSVYPPQPEGVVDVAYGKFAWTPSTGEDRYRRAIYTFSKRTAPFAMYGTFDAPSGEACVARRDVSNTPLQALTLMNDVMLVEATQALGKLTAEQSGDVESRITFMFRRVLARAPSANEIAALKTFIEAQQQRLENKQLDAATVGGSKDAGSMEQATWTLLARALFNLDEFVTRS